MASLFQRVQTIRQHPLRRFWQPMLQALQYFQHIKVSVFMREPIRVPQPTQDELTVFVVMQAIPLAVGTMVFVALYWAVRTVQASTELL